MKRKDVISFHYQRHRGLKTSSFFKLDDVAPIQTDIKRCFCCNNELKKTRFKLNEDGSYDKSVFKYKPSVEHIIPITQGGAYICSKNILILCVQCNTDRKDTPYEEFIKTDKVDTDIKKERINIIINYIKKEGKNLYETIDTNHIG